MGLCCCRIAGCFLLIYVCWDIKAVFYAIWSPFTFLVGYNDPRKPTDDLLHGERLPFQIPSLLRLGILEAAVLGSGAAMALAGLKSRAHRVTLLSTGQAYHL